MSLYCTYLGCHSEAHGIPRHRYNPPGALYYPSPCPGHSTLPSPHFGSIPSSPLPAPSSGYCSIRRHGSFGTCNWQRLSPPLLPPRLQPLPPLPHQVRQYSLVTATPGRAGGAPTCLPSGTAPAATPPLSSPPSPRSCPRWSWSSSNNCCISWAQLSGSRYEVLTAGSALLPLHPSYLYNHTGRVPDYLY